MASALGVAVIGVLFFSYLAGNADRAAATVVNERQQVFGAAATAEVRACLRDRAVGRDPNAAPASCGMPAVLALDVAAVQSAQELATLRNYAAAFVRALTWVLASLVFKYYISNFTDYNATYGAVGGVIVLLLWFYVSGIAILIGAEMNAEIEHASPYGKGPGQKTPAGRRVIGRRAARLFERSSAGPDATLSPAS